MNYCKNRFAGVLIVFAVLMLWNLSASGDESDLPAFGRDTVLVWKVKNVNRESSFVVRIASFYPDRFIEWESESSQGTVFMPLRDIQEAKDYVSRSLFEGGVDKRSKKNTTLWLSQRIYAELKSKGKAKCRLNGVGGELDYRGQDSLIVDVNGSPRELSAIKALDGRGSEFWFLDQLENPLMVKHTARNHNQTLSVIRTDRPNTLRWIKGTKLTNPPK